MMKSIRFLPDRMCDSMVFKKNLILRLDIIDINNLGYGVGKCDGMTIFVSGGVEGDLCDVKLIKVNKSYCIGIIDKLVIPSPFRISPDCPSASRCGGCSYQSITYERELKLKHNYVKNAFKKAGFPDVVVNDTVSDMNTVGYRNKAQYPISFENGEYILGFYASKTHRVISANQCTLQLSRGYRSLRRSRKSKGVPRRSYRGGYECQCASIVEKQGEDRVLAA